MTDHHGTLMVIRSYDIITLVRRDGSTVQNHTERTGEDSGLRTYAFLAESVDNEARSLIC